MGPRVALLGWPRNHAGVFDELTALTELYLSHNSLTELPDDVFEPLTSLSELYLSGNSGAPFSPTARRQRRHLHRHRHRRGDGDRRARRPDRPHGNGQREHHDQPLLDRAGQHRLQDRGLPQWHLQPFADRYADTYPKAVEILAGDWGRMSSAGRRRTGRTNPARGAAAARLRAANIA